MSWVKREDAVKHYQKVLTATLAEIRKGPLDTKALFSSLQEAIILSNALDKPLDKTILEGCDKLLSKKIVLFFRRPHDTDH